MIQLIKHYGAMLTTMLLLLACGVSGQTIKLHFPWLVGQTYDFTLFQGGKREVVQSDTIPPGGYVTLTVPPQYKGYAGMATWYITNSPRGGGLDLVINGEDFSVECLDSVPSATSIVYKNTKEALAMNEFYNTQQQLLARHDAMTMAMNAYGKDYPAYALFSKEARKVAKDFSAFSRKLDTSRLYAAKMRQIANITMGIPDTLVQNELERAQTINKYITRQMDWNALYTSNHWEAVIDGWCQMQLAVLKNDPATTQSLRTILNRIKTPELYTDFLEKATYRLVKAGRDSVVTAITDDVQRSGKLLRHNGVLVSYSGLAVGNQAPDIDVNMHLQNTSTAPRAEPLKSSRLGAPYTVLAFYQSGCGPCEQTMSMLKTNYSLIKEKQIRLISISADTEAQLFKNTAAGFPWADKYCDLQGLTGGNFKAYGIAGTPTLFLLDAAGRVKAKMATVEELLAAMKKM